MQSLGAKGLVYPSPVQRQAEACTWVPFLEQNHIELEEK